MSIIENNNGRMTVASGTDARKRYTVTQKNGAWRCSCPGWIFHSPRRDCKHIKLARSGEVKAESIYSDISKAKTPGALLDALKCAASSATETKRYYVFD